jgi:hypothetical protein
VKFLGKCFVVNDIDIHQLNIGPFGSLKLLVENPFKKYVFLHFLSNECIINFSIFEKSTILRKRKISYKWALHFFQFCLMIL